MKNLLLCWTLLSLFFCSSAQADIRFERFLPANPTAGQPIKVELWFSGFLGIWCDIVSPNSVPDSVSVSENQVRLQIPLIRRDCAGSDGDNPRKWIYDLTPLPAGNYTLTIVGRNIDAPPGSPLIEFFPTVPLVVGAGVEVPILTTLGVALLVVIILGFGIWRMRF